MFFDTKNERICVFVAISRNEVKKNKNVLDVCPVSVYVYDTFVLSRVSHSLFFDIYIRTHSNVACYRVYDSAYIRIDTVTKY